MWVEIFLAVLALASFGQMTKSVDDKHVGASLVLAGVSIACLTLARIFGR